MARSSAAAKSHKAKAAATGKAARLATRGSTSAAGTAVERAQKAAELRAAEAGERARVVQATARSQAREACDQVREAQAKARDQAREAQAKGAQAVKRARDEVTHLDDRAAELAAKVREFDPAERARETREQALERVGDWLSSGERAERLQVVPARRRAPVWLLVALGLVVGWAIAQLAKPRRDPYRDEFAEAADRTAVSVVPPPSSPVGVPTEPAATGASLAEQVRAALDSDVRTRQLPGLAINVAEGTVFVRGDVPEGTDESAIREVVASVPGVYDVDLQVRISQ